MYIYGSFLSQQGDTVTVHIVTNNDRSQTLEIGSEESDMYFSEDPAEITSEVNDTFDVLLRQSANIRLLCGNFIEDFFCSSCRDAIINIYINEKCVFAGFIEPQAYTQPYNERWDEIELNCIDVLSALQYNNYKNVGVLGVDYETVRKEAKERSFRDIMVEIMQGVAEGVDIIGNKTLPLWYDGSKSVNYMEDNRYRVFSQLTISELLFLDEDESDVWTQDAVLEEILKYLNLHIVQDGLDFYIFSWESIKDAKTSINWHNIMSDEAKTTKTDNITISLANVADCNTNISIGDVYNQLQLTAKTENVDNVIESPLDDDYLDSPYINRQKYMTEYSADGKGKAAWHSFYNMTHEKVTDFGGGAIVKWYLQIKRHKHWSFPMGGQADTDLLTHFCNDGKNQQALPEWLGENPGACIMALGSVKINTANNDNSPVSKVNMTNYLVVSVNGNAIDNDEEKTYPSESVIKQNIPYAIYNGNSAGGVFSPSDRNTTNYIVLSGDVILNPVMKCSMSYKSARYDMSYTYPIGAPQYTVPSRNNTDGRYYTRQFFRVGTPGNEEEWDVDNDSGFYPYTGDGPQEYEFKYSAVGVSSDNISKVSVLACMLVIGDKCVVETGTKGKTTDFEWKTFKERSECADDDEYYQQCFTIGFDPKIGDKLVGTEFKIQNNIDYKMGIDAEGIAIPITKGDKVSGRVRFLVLGPVNVVWGEITRRHSTFFRHTKWGLNTVPLMAHVSSILLKNFEVKVYSDNGLISTGNDDNDLIYLSDTNESFINKKDDIEFKINSALTAEECKSLGVSNAIKLSTPYNILNEEGVLKICDKNKNAEAKPEQHYVDCYYTEYHKPRIVMEQNLKDKDEFVNLFYHYKHAALNKSFYVIGLGRNLIEGRAALTLKEIWHD